MTTYHQEKVQTAIAKIAECLARDPKRAERLLGDVQRLVRQLAEGAPTSGANLPEIPFGPAFIDAYRKHYIAWGEQCFAAGAATPAGPENIPGRCVLIGAGATSEFSNCVVIGCGARSTGPNQLVIGNRVIEMSRPITDAEYDDLLKTFLDIARAMQHWNERRELYAGNLSPVNPSKVEYLAKGQ